MASRPEAHTSEAEAGALAVLDPPGLHGHSMLRGEIGQQLRAVASGGT